jgi:pilus assembly protein CpaC
VSAKTGFINAGLCVLSLLLCGPTGLLAQTTPQDATAGGTSAEDSANELSVAVGKSVLVDVAHPVKRVAIGMSEIAEASVISRNEIMVNGKAPGETSLIIWDITGGRQFFNITVRASGALSNDHLDAIRRELRTELPGQPLKVSGSANAIFLRGTVKDLNSSERAVKIAATAGKVINLLNVDVPQAESQILLKVRFASVDRNKAKQLGINLVSLGLGNTVGGITTGQFSAPTITTSPTTGTQATYGNSANILVESPGGLPMGLDIQALETKGVTEVLAEPNIVAANGKEASFLAGGEYPFPVVQGGSGGSGSSVSIMFKEYGIRLNFIPTITPRGTIRLQVAPEVSSLDFTNAIQVSGFDVPAITSRKVNTEVELADGQSFVIGGLLDNNETETFQKIPFLGDIPILGKFFQSMSRSRNNTELIVLVTPSIVAPIPVGAPLPELKYPTKFMEANSPIPMNHPDAKTQANTPPPPPPTMPIEKLIESMKPESPLVVDAGKGGFGASSTTTPAASAPSAPPQ